MFERFLQQILLGTKVAQIFGDFLAYLEKHHFVSNNCCCYFKQIVVKLGYFFCQHLVTLVGRKWQMKTSEKLKNFASR